MDSATYSDSIFREFARIGKAVASPRRLQLLEILAQGPRTVETLAERAGMSVANTSQHLQQLRQARLVQSERSGQFVTYSLAGDEVRQLLVALRSVADARLVEVEQLRREYLADCESMEHVDKDVLIDRVRRGDVLVVDVRPSEEFEAGHIAGAISVPLDRLEELVGELPRDKDLAAYCRGSYCVLAVDAVELLKKHGFNAYHLQDGVLELEAQGVQIEAAIE